MAVEECANRLAVSRWSLGSQVTSTTERPIHARSSAGKAVRQKQTGFVLSGLRFQIQVKEKRGHREVAARFAGVSLLNDVGKN